jgi:F-type H+-transporting ATPase subunit a
MILGIEADHVVHELLNYKIVGPINAHVVLLILASLILIVGFGWAAKALPTDAPRKTGFLALLEFGLVWVRDEIAYAFMGPTDGKKYLPFIWTLFFFILVSNVLGLAPFPISPGGLDKGDAFAVATGNIAVTSALAVITLVLTTAAGFTRQGPIKYFKTLVPHGVPAVIVPLIFLMEFIGLFTKPFALLIRLFANMVAGHALLAILFSMLVGVAAFSGGQIALTVVGVFGIIGVLLLEVLIALLQAYIFAALSATFIAMAIDPGH